MSEITSPHRSGSVAVIGRPNVGKSTLTNALVGAKVSIVSNRPQTTRHRLLGIATFPEGQLVLVDTPGLHREQKRAMNRVMNRAARGSLEGVDAAVLVIEAGRWDEEDTLAFRVLSDAGVPVVLVVNKVDRLKDKTALFPFLAQVSEGRTFAAVHPVSALKRKGLDASIKDVHGAPVGDTLTLAGDPAPHALPGFQEMQPRVFAGLFPVDAEDYPDLREALDKLRLNDAALRFEPESSEAMGFGFRCGFLGMLHMEIVQERLEREYNLDLISTAPTVVYEVLKTDGTVINMDNPAKLPQLNLVQEIREPIIRANVLTPEEYIGNIIKLCEEKRGTQIGINYLGSQVQISYELPMAEVVLDFFDKLKSVSRGYASLDYHFVRFDAGPFVRVDVLINGDKVDALSLIVHRGHADRRGRELCEKMKDLIPRQMFDVAIQAAIGSQIISRSTVKAMRKNVLAKCYGGDVSRKKKLLEKQKEGKKRMKQVGRVEIPQEAFLAVLQMDK